MEHHTNILHPPITPFMFGVLRGIQAVAENEAVLCPQAYLEAGTATVLEFNRGLTVGYTLAKLIFRTM